MLPIVFKSLVWWRVSPSKRRVVQQEMLLGDGKKTADALVAKAIQLWSFGKGKWKQFHNGRVGDRCDFQTFKDLFGVQS